MPTFVLNCENTVNSYGFRIPNKGINMSRFKGNPVMLDQHYNSTRSVIGRWLKLEFKDNQFLGDPEFDAEDEDAKKIEGKVNRGYIKGASMGVTFNPEYMVKAPDGVYELTQCELFEVSIVAVPSNASALTLFAESGLPLSENEVKLSISQLATQFKDEHTKTKKMEKIILSAVALTALGLSVSPENSNELNTAIEGLQVKLAEKTAALAAETKSKEDLAKQITEQVKLQATALVDAAVLEGKMTADVKEQFVQMALANPELAAKVIGAMPAKTSLGATIHNTGAPGEIKSLEEFEKLPVAKQLAFKAENPEAYKALFA